MGVRGWVLKATVEEAVAGRSGLEEGVSLPPGGPAGEEGLGECPSECSRGCTLPLSVCQWDLDTSQGTNYVHFSESFTDSFGI